MNHKWNYQPPSQEQTEAAKALAKEQDQPIFVAVAGKRYNLSSRG